MKSETNEKFRVNENRVYMCTEVEAIEFDGRERDRGRNGHCDFIGEQTGEADKTAGDIVLLRSHSIVHIESRVNRTFPH